MTLMPVEPPAREASPVPKTRFLPRKSPLIQIAVHSNIYELEEEWLAFQAHASGTLYQTYQWCRAWQETAAKARNVEPRIITGREGSGRLLFILPLGLRHVRGMRILEWHSGRQCNYGYGLYDRGFLRPAENWFASQGPRILALAGPVDVIDLADMPAQWNGYRHPLSSWFSLPGPNASFLMRLGRNFEALYAEKRSAETRRGNRKRDAKLAKEGEVAFGLPRTREEIHARIEEMFEHQAQRLAENGIYDVFGRAAREFIHRLVDLPDHMQPILLPYHLSIDGGMEAMMLGGNYGNGYWALISSLAASSSRRHSPGEAALRKTIEACCDRGLSFFDFSSGNTAYKLHWADEAVTLHHAIRAVTPRGYAWAAGRIAIIAAKRSIKRSPILWSFASSARRGLAQIRRPRPSE
jgi:CelD/BcsL family acetyltransferase involved in cellulose biosynthesis